MHGKTISYRKSVIYSICQDSITISIVCATMKQNTKGKWSFVCRMNWSTNSESIWWVRGNKFSTLETRNFDPDAYMWFVSIKILRDSWEKYWVCAQTATSVGRFICPTWEPRKEAEHFVFNICRSVKSVLMRIGKSPHVHHTVEHMGTNAWCFFSSSLRTCLCVVLIFQALRIKRLGLKDCEIKKENDPLWWDITAMDWRWPLIRG